MAQKDIIVYKFSQLESLSARMGQVVTALDEVKNLSQSSGKATGEFWQGTAYSAFLRRLTNMNNSLDKLYEQVSASKEKFDKAIQIEKQNEANITQTTVGGLSADEIF